MFDIVIPVGPKDRDIVIQQLNYTKKNIIGYRNIYIIHYDASFSAEGCIVVPESVFPFTMDTVRLYHGTLDRNGWYLQQLLKLYAGFVIPDILDTYLVLDSDTFFLKPTTFVKDGKCLYNYGSEYHLPYFTHMKLMCRGFQKQTNVSGICHHMMFETKILRKIFDTVENIHKQPFYKVFLKNVTDVRGSGASEYELYFNYILMKHSSEIVIRRLHWTNTNSLQVDGDYDYISYHWYLRE